MPAPDRSSPLRRPRRAGAQPRPRDSPSPHSPGARARRPRRRGRAPRRRRQWCAPSRRGSAEIPLPQRALLALDDQQRLAEPAPESSSWSASRWDRPDRLTRAEHAKADAELRELRIALELAAARDRPRAAAGPASRAFRTNHPSPAGSSPTSGLLEAGPPEPSPDIEALPRSDASRALRETATGRRPPAWMVAARVDARPQRPRAGCDTLSFRMMFDTWTLAVLTLIVSSAAISRFEYPRARSWRTSFSRAVRPRASAGFERDVVGWKPTRSSRARCARSCSTSRWRGRGPSLDATRWASRAGRAAPRPRNPRRQGLRLPPPAVRRDERTRARPRLRPPRASVRGRESAASRAELRFRQSQPAGGVGHVGRRLAADRRALRRTRSRASSALPRRVGLVPAAPPRAPPAPPLPIPSAHRRVRLKGGRIVRRRPSRPRGREASSDLPPGQRELADHPGVASRREMGLAAPVRAHLQVLAVRRSSRPGRLRARRWTMWPCSGSRTPAESERQASSTSSARVSPPSTGAPPRIPGSRPTP